jgi:hypothetical protein
VGVLRSARRTGGPSPGFGAFSSSPYTVPLCWVWGPGIAVLWSYHEGVVIEFVTVFACFFFFLLLRRECVEKKSVSRAALVLLARGQSGGGRRPAEPVSRQSALNGWIISLLCASLTLFV